MAKPAAKRTYTNVDAASGLGTLRVKVDGDEGKERFTAVSGIASNSKSFAAMVANALKSYTDKPETDDAKKLNSNLDSLFSIYTRGVESAARVSFKSKNNTEVSIGGKKKIDLLAFALSDNPKFGIKPAIQMLNNRFATLALLEASDETAPTPEQKNALRKREAGWFNTADALVAAGKVQRDSAGMLSIPGV